MVTISGWLATEARVWAALRRRVLSTEEFAYGADLRPLLGAVMAVLLVEGIVVEVVVAVIAGHGWWLWMLALVHLYALVWIGGIISSLRTLPHAITPSGLLLRDSVFGEYRVAIDAIVRVRKALTPNIGRTGLVVDPETQTGRLCHGDGSVVLDLREESTIQGIPVRRLAISVDEPSRFVSVMSSGQQPPGSRSQ